MLAAGGGVNNAIRDLSGMHNLHNLHDVMNMLHRTNPFSGASTQNHAYSLRQRHRMPESRPPVPF
jgi:hypothetical protein